MNPFSHEESSQEKIVLQTTDYNCGPAALATVLKGLGINCSEQEIANIAGTDETGTSMYGLLCAARVKGIDAVGMRRDVDFLEKMDIVFLNFGGKFHYSVIARIKNGSIVLADPALGKIEITKDYFKKIYTGNALVIRKSVILKGKNQKN